MTRYQDSAFFKPSHTALGERLVKKSAIARPR
jgi:hypothetical protein